jgi:hypothetical protein
MLESLIQKKGNNTDGRPFATKEDLSPSFLTYLIFPYKYLVSYNQKLSEAKKRN